MIATDASWGVLTINNFDIINGGINLNNSKDNIEISKWLLNLGTLFGSTLYDIKENTALKEIELYAMNEKCTKLKLVKQILKSCMKVLTNCKLMEIWGMNNNLKLKKISSILPKQTVVPKGKLLLLSKIKIKPLEEKKIPVVTKKKIKKKVNTNGNKTVYVVCCFKKTYFCLRNKSKIMKTRDKAAIDPKITGLNSWIEGVIIKTRNNPFIGNENVLKSKSGRIYFNSEIYFKQIN